MLKAVFLALVVLATSLNNAPAQVTCTGTVIYAPVGGQGMPVLNQPNYFPQTGTPYTGMYLNAGQQVVVYEAVQKPDNGGEIWYRIGTDIYVQGFGAGWFRMVTLNPGCPYP